VASLTIPDSHRDLLEAPLPVALVTLSSTGHPQVTYVWAILDADTVVMSFPSTRQKAKNLHARPQATVFVGDPQNAMRSLEVRGDVELEADPELTTLGRVLSAYDTSLGSFSGPLDNRVAARLTPSRVVAQG
jgi:PPOX class probable F420-dependent enzyme